MIERDSTITESKKGKSILRLRHHLIGARKVANGLVDHLFAFVDQQGKPMLIKDESNEMILFDPARLFQFMIEVFDLKEKALRGEVSFAITGDAATVCTGGTKAGQCLFRIKPINQDAKHPLMGKPMLCRAVKYDDDCDRWEYFGAQSTDCCFVAGACMMKENETMASLPFQHYARTMLAIAREGIPADGDKPAFPP
mmetsp:Transcript_3932/g.5884  ORF Transcript_3932/g.5884 Transcript_3932/m.5884 type:complete len:197 (+) Transcript_3932:289-879(+)